MSLVVPAPMLAIARRRFIGESLIDKLEQRSSRFVTFTASFLQRGFSGHRSNKSIG